MLLSQVPSPSLTTTDVEPRETRLSNTSSRSPLLNISRTVRIPGPVKVQGAVLVCSATGLVAGPHVPAQLKAAEPAALNWNSCQEPSAKIALPKDGIVIKER